jgi:hypothetical protein
MLPILSALTPILSKVFDVVDKSIQDKDLAAKLKTELNEQLLKSGTEELKASARIVEAEAKAGWFAASWRPLLMYVLIFILVWNYILAPLVSAITHGTTIINFNLPGDVWTLLQIGLGGYVVGRSGESIARTIANRPTNQGDKDA